MTMIKSRGCYISLRGWWRAIGDTASYRSSRGHLANVVAISDGFTNVRLASIPYPLEYRGLSLADSHA